MVGYGSGGRYAGRPAYDDLIQAASGIPMLLQRSTGQPRFIPMAAIDRIVGSAAANALLAGLLARARSGIGQCIEVPMFETMAQFVLSEHMQGTTFDPPTSPPGYPRTLSPHRRPYQTKDGYIAVLPYNDGQWRRFFAAIGKAHIVETDPRFADITARTANIDALYAMLGEELQHRTTDEWLELLQQNDIPCIRPHTLESLLDDPHLADIGFFRLEEHPSEGRIRTMREPSTWSETVPPTGRFAPRLGQHTRAVLAEAGYAPDEIDTLLAARAVMTDRTGD
jgi:crotonobetainyl-CoA:carnitine CoA-transferase CaiB-like acyl-CoA transferase